jgi:hypothetical protein
MATLKAESSPASKVDERPDAGCVGGLSAMARTKRSTREAPGGGRPLRPIIQEQVRRECRAMVRHLLAAGHDLPSWIVLAVAKAEVSVPERAFDELCQIHTYLADLVAPARPASILLVESEVPRGMGRMRGPLGILGQLAVLNMVFLLALLGLALSPYVNEDPSAGDFFDSQGLPLLANLGFIVAAAGLGVSFGTLFEIQDRVIRRTFDPVCVVIYWTRLPLGIVSGVFLSNLLVGSLGSQNGLAKPLLALLGGFSAPLVHRLLTRLLDTVAKVVGSSASDAEVRNRSDGQPPGAGLGGPPPRPVDLPRNDHTDLAEHAENDDEHPPDSDPSDGSPARTSLAKN